MTASTQLGGFTRQLPDDDVEPTAEDVADAIVDCGLDPEAVEPSLA